MICPDHGNVKATLQQIPNLHNNCFGFKIPCCPVCGLECRCPTGKLKCPHAPSWGGGPPSYEYCIKCEVLEDA